MATILALDPDRLQLGLLGFLLKQDRHELCQAVEPQEALNVLRSKFVDLVIVEPALPGYDGYAVCRSIRERDPDVPLMIVSERAAEAQVVQGLRTVADEYVTKPVSPHAFLARVHALLRRSNASPRGAADEILTTGEIELNLIQMQAVINSRRVPLTPRELWLLHSLMSNIGRVLSREQLMRLAWGEQFMGGAKSVDVCIQRIRKKICPHLLRGPFIEAVRGFGYQLGVPSDGIKRQPVSARPDRSASPLPV